MFMAHRQSNVAVIYITVKHVVLADWLFTTPSVIVQLLTGLWLVQLGGYALNDAWIFWALLLYAFAGICWMPVVWIQIKMRDMAKDALETQTPLPARYHIMNRWWVTLGSLAFPAVVVIFYLMVFKIS